MHPPFIFTDHKVSPDIFAPSDHKQQVKRSLPERLALRPVTSAWPPLPVVPEPPVPYSALRLQIVPPPRGTLRDAIGRWLIRTGQRMILKNRLGQ